MRYNQFETALSNRCNLACPWCYSACNAQAKFDQAQTRKNLSWFLAQAPQRRTLKNGRETPAPRVSFFGGEPLHEWDALVETVEWLREQVPDIRIGIVSNMSLLSSEKLEWLAAHKVAISASVDGCPEVVSARVDKHTGKSREADIYRGAKVLLAKYPHKTCRATVSPATVDRLTESVIYLHEEVGFQTVNCVLAGGCANDWMPVIPVLAEQITKLTDWWIEKMRAGVFVDLFHLRNHITSLWKPGNLVGRNLCKAGCQTIACTVEGDLYPCHRFCNPDTDPEWMLGNTTDGITNRTKVTELKTHDQHKWKLSRHECQQCPALLTCRARCSHELQAAGMGLEGVLPHYCASVRVYAREARRAHATLIAERNKLYRDTYRPGSREGRRTV